MPWFQARNGRLEFTRRMYSGSFLSWLRSPQGRDAAADVGATIGFSLLGRRLASRVWLWEQLATAGRSPQMAAALETVAELHARALADLADESDLPRVTARMRRVVLVPRALVLARARARVEAHLGACAALAQLHGGLRAFVISQALGDVDAALCAAKPSAARPVETTSRWSCVGVDTKLGWMDQVWSGRRCPGHFAVFERRLVMEADRKPVEKAVARLQAGVQAYPRQRRQQLADAASRA